MASYTDQLLRKVSPYGRIVCSMVPFEGNAAHWNPRTGCDPKPFVSAGLRYSGRECHVEEPVAFIDDDGNHLCLDCCPKPPGDSGEWSCFSNEFAGDVTFYCYSCGKEIQS